MRVGFLDDALDALRRGKGEAVRAFGEGREDHREALKRARTDRDKDIEGTRIGQMMGTNRTVTLGRELLGLANEEDVRRRNEMGLGIPEGRAEKVGYILGTLGADIVQDRGRNIYWLLNAPQATANVIQDIALNRGAPQLFASDYARNPDKKIITSKKQAFINNIANKDGDPNKGYFRGRDGYRKRNYEPGHVDLLAIPAGIAVNSSIGLLNPFGGQEGYKAVMPSEEDPSKTSNVIGEVAAKYILGRTGGLLNWDDFKEVRPDGSKEVTDAAGNLVKSKKQGYLTGIANKDGDPNKGYFRGKESYRQRNYEPGHVDLLAIPAGIAINSSIGLLNPFGGQEGYKAVMPSEEDPSKTSNVIGEVAAKYILGRTGGLLNWDDFKKVRPDVSKDEYMRYKAFKYDNDLDLNPMDGDVVLPGGIIKYTDEGIHGPEVQFLGRSLH